MGDIHQRRASDRLLSKNVPALSARPARRLTPYLITLHSQSHGWGRHVSFPLYEAAVELIRDATTATRGNQVLQVCATLLWYVCLVRVARMRVPRAYVAYAGLVVLLATWSGPLVSVGRIGMVAFPLFWGLAALGTRRTV